MRFFVMKEKLTFECKVKELKSKETIENDVEHRLVLTTMDKSVKKMQGEISHWVKVEVTRLRTPRSLSSE